MNAEDNHGYGSALYNTLGALFLLLGRKDRQMYGWMDLRASFTILHFSGVGGFFRPSRTTACVADVLDRERPPARLAIHTCLIIGFSLPLLFCSSRCQV